MHGNTFGGIQVLVLSAALIGRLVIQWGQGQTACYTDIVLCIIMLNSALQVRMGAFQSAFFFCTGVAWLAASSLMLLYT